MSKPKRLLIVDDEPEFLRAICPPLRDIGYDVVETVNGTEALELLETQHSTIDLLIVDLCLPDINGLEIIGAVTRRELPVKIIATSGVFDRAYLEMLKDAGADVGLRKQNGRPVPIEAWIESIARLIGDAVETPPASRLGLVVDDDHAVRRFAKLVLEKAGFQVLEAADGEAALALLRSLGDALAILVTDVNMPLMDGVALARNAFLDRPEMPVVFMSALLPDDVAEICRARRLATFVQKPFVLGSLLAAVQAVLPSAFSAGSR